MLEGVARSFAFGATLAAAVGPIAVLILNYGIRSGLRQAARLTRYEHTLRIVSALVLVALGTWGAVRAVRSANNRLDLQPREDLSPPSLAAGGATFPATCRGRRGFVQLMLGAVSRSPRSVW